MNELTFIDTKEVDARVESNIVVKAKALVIINDDDCRMAIEYENAIKELIKDVESRHNENIDAANKLHKNLIKERDVILKPCQEALKIRKGIRIEYVEEQETIRKAAIAAAQAEAKRLAEEAAFRDAIAAEDEGRTEDATAILEEPIDTPVIIIPNTTPKAGISGAIRELWSAEVYDLPALLQAIVSGKASMGLIEPNMTALNGMARALHENMIIPGVSAVSRKI